MPAGAAGAGRSGPGVEDRAVHRGPAGHLRPAYQREHEQLPDLLRHPGPGQLPESGRHVGDPGLHLQPHPEERCQEAVHLCVHRRVLSAPYGRTQLRVPVHSVEAGSEILCLLHGHHTGCGRYAPEPSGPDHAGQLRTAGPVQPVRLCSEHPVTPVEHNPGDNPLYPLVTTKTEKDVAGQNAPAQAEG